MSSELLAAARRLAQELEQSTVRVRRKTGETRNQQTGKLEPTWATVYEGPGRLRQSNAQPRAVDVAGQRLEEQTPTLSLPVDDDPRIVTGTSAGVRVDDEGVVLTNPDDPGIVGQTFRVSGLHGQTHSSARRLPVEVHSHA